MNGYGIIRTFGVVVLLVAASVLSGSDAQSSGSDPLLTPAETGSAFYPDKPMELRVRFSDTGKVVETYLNPSEGKLIGEDTPVWRAFKKPDGTIEYLKIEKGIVGKVMSKFFTDATDLSTLPVSPTKSGDPTFNGVIGDLIIHPLPLASPSVDASRVNGSTEKTIYPSLLVQTTFKVLEGTHDDADFYDEILYQVAFWNAVDLRFRQVTNPKIRLRIAGIIIGMDRSAILGKSNAGKTEALDALGKHWYNMSNHSDFPFEAYDIVMTMADIDMYEDSSSTIGIGKKSFCMPPSDEKYHAVGIFRDNYDFRGILHAARSLGSIFGLSDDTASGDECDVSEGFIMRPAGKTGPHFMEWSPCSLRNFSVVLRDVNCSDKPAEFHSPGRTVQKPLPGDILTPDELCKTRGFDLLCDMEAVSCSDMRCMQSFSGFVIARWCESIGPPPDGTKCGVGKKCIGGTCECVSAECMYCKVESSGVGG